MKFEALRKCNLKGLLLIKVALTIALLIATIGEVDGSANIKKIHSHKHVENHHNERSGHPAIPAKANVKKSAMPNVPMPFKEHHEKLVGDGEKPKREHEHDLPTLAEINSVQGNKNNNNEHTAHETHSVKRIETSKDKSEKPRTKNVYSSNSSSSKSGGFFSDTSKKNRNAAWEALAGFVTGIILFFVSIQLICWNERRAVKFANFIDWVLSDSHVFPLGNQSLSGEKLEGKAYIVNGTLKVTSEPLIEYKDFDQIMSNMRVESNHKLLFVKFSFEQWKVISQTQTGIARKDEHGNDEEEIQIQEDWVSIPEESNEKFGTKLFSGVANLSDVYKLNLDRIYPLVDFANYQPSSSDLSIVESFVAAKTNNSSEYKVFHRDSYFYIIYSPANENLTNETFNAESYEFKENDRRFSLNYYKVDEANTKENKYTLAGKLVKEDEMYSVTPFDSPIRQAEWSFYLCCFGETDECYKVDLVAKNALSKKEIIDNYEAENKACTCILRVVGFILHFLSYYLILYPLILLIGMIPFLGAVGATVLVVFAFLFACITYLFIIAVAWVFARPLMAFLLFGVIAVLMVVSKTSRDKFVLNNRDGYAADFSGPDSNSKMKFL